MWTLLFVALVALAAYALNALFEWTGWQIALGFAAGTITAFSAFRLHYGWWSDFNVDGEDDQNRRLPRL